MAALTADELARRAEIAERTATRAEAQAAWNALIATAPQHPRALFALARQRIEQGDPSAALPLLARAEAGDGTYAEIPFYAALAHRMKGEFESAIAAIDRALAIDAYFFMALLSKGALYEKLGKPKAAARIFKNALKLAPTDDRLPPSQRAAVDHARNAVRAYAEGLREHMRQRTANAAQNLGEDTTRFEESMDILAGLKPRQVHDPILYYYPRLPAITFFDRELFPWLEKLEAATDVIRGELEHVLSHEWDRFAPYIQMPPEAPVNQWAELNHSKSWSTLYLWRDGQKQNEVCARCPQTAALLESLPMAKQGNLAPTAVFSVLSPHTRIPPHTGSTNIRLLTHLPLILPPKCGFRVGNDAREWRMGEAWVFDDSIDHEAWNDSDATRVILIFDVWNPLLSEAERAAATQLLHALNEYDAET